MSDLDIGEVSKQARVRPSTLRFYEERGLIASNGRKGLRRQYPDSVLDRLALIALGQAAGLSLDEITLMFAVDGRPRIDRALLAAKADELNETIQRMTVVRDGLRHAAACPAPSHAECPTFRRLIRAAVSGKISTSRVHKPNAALP